ncbi:hypothetical protein [Shewanella acanthi]|uniref:hypothetical protein n=1 Tax=Shewanella acanthi TaxID=2864212 RepID=UPI0021AD00B8|nr:hypothetical protein [Shewanella acanthi]
MATLRHRLSNAFQGLTHPAAIGSVIKHRLRVLRQFILSLSLAQRYYFLALSALIIFQDDVWLAATITALALILEFWPKFAVAWHSLAGKAIFLLFYAVIANFALAASGSVVNEITGVSASHLSYTHNFAILLYLPIWFVGISIIALLLLQLFIPGYLFFHVCLKLLGIESSQQGSKKRFVVTTALVRLILSVVLLANLIIISDSENWLTDWSNQRQAAKQAQLNDAAGMNEQAAINHSASKSLTDSKDSQALKAIGHNYYTGIRSLIASFAYKFEADGRSRCEKLPNSVVVELNDYEILEITEAKKEPYGYHFEVKKCVSPAFGQVTVVTK